MWLAGCMADLHQGGHQVEQLADAGAGEEPTLCVLPGQPHLGCSKRVAGNAAVWWLAVACRECSGHSKHACCAGCTESVG